MKKIILDNSTQSLALLKSARHVAYQLRTHNGGALACKNYQQLLKEADQNYDQSTQVKSRQATHKAYTHEKYHFISGTETSVSCEESHNIDSNAQVLLANVMNRKSNNKIVNRNSNKSRSFDQDRIIPK